MVTRLSRRNRTYSDIGYKTEAVGFDIIDNTFKEIYRLKDDEYDFICEHATDEDIEILVGVKDKYSFSDRKKILSVLFKYTSKFETNEIQ